MTDTTTPLGDKGFNENLAGGDQATRGGVLPLIEEMRALPTFQRGAVLASLMFLATIVIQGTILMPLILFRFGWGYNVG
jgi:hypothetical protein